jgi:hypothetical protein
VNVLGQPANATQVTLRFSPEVEAALIRLADALALTLSLPSAAIQLPACEHAPAIVAELGCGDATNRTPVSVRAVLDVSSLNSPAASPPPPAPFQMGWKTPKRVEVMRREYPRGTPMPEIRALLEQLPGAKLPHNGLLQGHCAGMGLRRPQIEPETTKPETTKIAAPQAEPEPQRRPATSADLPSSRPAPGPVTVSHEFARRWGAERGLSSRTLDLDAVNVKRRGLGLNEFRLESPGGLRRLG